MSGPILTASDAEQVADVSSVVIVETSSNTPPGDAVLPTMSLPPVAPDAEKVTQAAIEEATLSVATSEAFQKDKIQVSD